jgi:hypothetical protein
MGRAPHTRWRHVRPADAVRWFGQLRQQRPCCSAQGACTRPPWPQGTRGERVNLVKAWSNMVKVWSNFGGWRSNYLVVTAVEASHQLVIIFSAAATCNCAPLTLVLNCSQCHITNTSIQCITLQHHQRYAVKV